MTDEKQLGDDLKLAYSSSGNDLGIDNKGDLAIVSGRDNMVQAIMNRLNTRQGELTELGHPGYGSRLHELIGENNNEKTRRLAELFTRECLSQEPRIKDVVWVKVETADSERDILRISVSVRLIDSPEILNLVYPFYLNPEEIKKEGK